MGAILDIIWRIVIVIVGLLIAVIPPLAYIFGNKKK